MFSALCKGNCRGLVAESTIAPELESAQGAGSKRAASLDLGVKTDDFW